MTNTIQLTELNKAVITQMGYDYDTATEEEKEEIIETLQDVLRGGADAGYFGFTYYSETNRFYDKNEDLIKQHLKDHYQEFGYSSIIEMVKSFNCFKQFKKDEIELFFMGMLEEEDAADITKIKNGLAWYALEQTARELNPEF